MQLEQLPQSLSKLYMNLELDIMKEITVSIKSVSKMEYAEYLVERAFALGIGEKDIKTMIKRTAAISEKEIDTIVTRALKEDYGNLRELYKKKGIDYIPFEENQVLQQQIEAIKAQTIGECKNITNTLGFASEKGGTVVFNDLTSFYQSTMDKVVLQVSTGAFDYTTAMTRAVKSMTQSGLRTIDYASGTKNKVEVATRRSLMTGITQLSGKVSLSNATKLGIETFEVTAHGGARNTGSGYLNHAGWQGKVYTLKQLEEICGYGQGGGLKGWNCRHDFYPFDEEFSPRMYPDSELKELAKQENTKTEYKGEKYTTYEATQAQRKLETRMRYQRQNMELMEAADLDSLQSEKVLYQRTKQEYIQFSKAMDMPTQFERVKVDGLGRV